MLSLRNLLLATTIVVVAVAAGVDARAAPGAAARAPASPPPLKLLGPAPGAQTVAFDVVLPLSNPGALDAMLAAQQNPTSPSYHKWLKPADFAARFGPSQQSLNAAAAALKTLGLSVSPQSRSLHVTGTAAQISQAFNIELVLAEDASGQQRLVANNTLAVPGALSDLGAVISAFKASGFGAAPLVHRSGSGYAHRAAGGYGSPASSSSPPGGYLFNNLKQAYDFPSVQTTIGKGQRVDGTGTTVAVIMASDVLDSDVTTLFEYDRFRANSGQPADPKIFAREPVNGGALFSANSPSSEEATLDVEQVLGTVPGAHVVLYNTPDLSDQSLISALTAVVNDDTADVVSMSFGQCELYYTAAYNSGQDQSGILEIYSELFKQGNAEGITFLAASGDQGGLSCLNPEYFEGNPGHFIPGVSVPAADPNVTAVGGTNLVTASAAGASGSSYVRENAWSDPELPFDPFGLGAEAFGGVWGAGGGVSTLFAQPSYQAAVNAVSTAFRAVPDVAMEMGGCPDIAQTPCNGGGSIVDGFGNTDRSLLNIVFNGVWDGVVGTSAAAPAMAGAVALLVEVAGRQGNLNPTLYSLAQRQAVAGTGYFHRAIPGFNGLAINAGTYTFTTGNGSPDVRMLLGLANASAAGVPQSASNP